MNITVELVIITLRLWSLMEDKQTALRSGSFFKAMECPSGLDQIMHTCIYSLGFPCGSVVKNLPANAGDIRDVGSVPVLGRSPGVEDGNPLQYSCLENPMV